MKMNRCFVLCGFFIGLCLLTNNQESYSAPPAIPFQRCPDTGEYIATKESGRPSNSWRGLTPLKSTRSDVEALVGKANWSHGSTFIYETPCGRLDVLYSRGSCELTDVQRWNVPEDVVIRMEFAPQKRLLVLELNLPAKRYSREQETHPENWVRYKSEEDGILINALLGRKADTVSLITYQPTKNQEQLFRCSRNAKLPLQLKENADRDDARWNNYSDHLVRKHCMVPHGGTPLTFHLLAANFKFSFFGCYSLGNVGADVTILNESEG